MGYIGFYFFDGLPKIKEIMVDFYFELFVNLYLSRNSHQLLLSP